MDANSKSKLRNKTFIREQLLVLNVEKAARETGFYKALARKITITGLMLSFFHMALSGKKGYHIWAVYLGQLIGQSVSKVALWKRMGKSQTDCLRLILEQTFHMKLPGGLMDRKSSLPLFSPFGETYMQDSTIISLPDELSLYYKGSVSHGKQKSSMRLQAIYSLSSGTFKEFAMDSFTDNDQGASGGIIRFLKPGDLVIRDLGYFVLKVFQQVASLNAFFLSRWRYGVTLYDATTGEPLEPGKVLRGSAVDIQVVAGAKEKLPCRLVAVRLPEHMAAQRRRIAKNDRDKRLNHSRDYMQALSWAIFITNIGPQVWGPWEILMAYRLRWHIEIIFKGWKSHLNMASLVPQTPRANRNQERYLSLYKDRVDSAILMMLIFITIFHIRIYTSLGFRIWQNSGKLVSSLKLYAFIATLKEKILECITPEDMEVDIAYYATYEKRRKRLNHLEILYQTFDCQ
jgi:hypothetical protein